MFMAGIVPGLLMGVALVIVVMLEAKKHNIKPSREKASGKERWDAFKDAFWGFLMPVIILGRYLRRVSSHQQKQQPYPLYTDSS